ncbi:hypothetical protein, partial [Clostridium perfringens]
ALAYSGASLPLNGGILFARVWSSVLPLTHYVALEMDQTIGVSLATWGRQAAVLALVPLVAGGAALLVIRRQMRRAA